VHDSHKYSVHTSCTAPTLHFHLAASINSNTGELVDVLQTHVSVNV